MMIIYKITNLVNGKIYIGKSNKSKNKFLESDYYGSGIIIKQSIRKYGIKNFKRDILEECKTKEELCDTEKFLIQKLNAIQPIGYNIAFGGNGGNTLTNHPNIKVIGKKISIKNSGCKNGMYGKISPRRGTKNNNISNLKNSINNTKYFYIITDPNVYTKNVYSLSDYCLKNVLNKSGFVHLFDRNYKSYNGYKAVRIKK